MAGIAVVVVSQYQLTLDIPTLAAIMDGDITTWLHPGVLELGLMDVRRDWGCASDHVRAMHLATQQEHPDDYVVATGESHSLAEFVVTAFLAVGITDHEGLVATDPELVRPTDIPEMRGDPSKAESILGWRREVGFVDCIRAMVAVDVQRLETAVEHDPAYLTMGLPTGT